MLLAMVCLRERRVYAQGYVLYYAGDYRGRYIARTRGHDAVDLFYGFSNLGYSNSSVERLGAFYGCIRLVVGACYFIWRLVSGAIRECLFGGWWAGV